MSEDDDEQEIDEDVAMQGAVEDAQDVGEYIGEQQEEQSFGNYPGTRVKDSIYTFFRHILGLTDSSKVGNLDKSELGRLDMTVRNYEYLSKLGGILHNRSYEEFFMGKAEITLATSMSKKGWFPELIVSQKRFNQRMVQPTVPPQQQKKGFLGIGKKPQPQ